MIGVFDSGLGGLTVLKVMVSRFPKQHFVYLGDHANVPYGDRPSDEIVALTTAGVETLFRKGCRLALLGCNTATAIAARHLQRTWLPGSAWADHNVLGIVAPTVEAATQVPWAVTSPPYPQKNNMDVIAVFATTRTVASGVYPEEIRKRCPKVTVIQQACPKLVDAIEAHRDEDELNILVRTAVLSLLAQPAPRPPQTAVLGCTHYPIVEHLFRRHLPPSTRLLSQPEIVSDSLEDYLTRHPRFASESENGLELLTTGIVADVEARARVVWPDAPRFEALSA